MFRFFSRERDAYYSCHGDNADVLAAQFFKTRSVVKVLGEGADGVPSVTLNHKTFGDALRFVLIERGCAVEVLSGAGRSWTVTKTASPGNLQAFVDVLASSPGFDDTTTAAALYLPDATTPDPPTVIGLCVVR